MKKLLYITAFPPNRKTGGQQFSLNAIDELAQEFAVDVFYFAYPEHTCELSVDAGASCHGIHSVQELPIRRFDFLRHFWIHPIFTRRFNRSVLQQIQKIALQYDILYFDFSQVAFYSLYVEHPHKILRMHDVLCQKFSRKNLLLAKWITLTERKILCSFEKIFVPSEKDVELIDSLYGIHALYTNEYVKTVDFSQYVEQKNQFVFYGYWKRAENTDGLIWFIDRVLPLLKNNYTFIVIGSGLNVSLQEKYLAKNNIEYLGFIENPLEIMMRSSAVLVPLFQGAGIKVKVIDSFSVGTPVIGTELAFEGLPKIAGLSFFVKDAVSFAKQIEDFVPLLYAEKKAKAKIFDSLYNNHHLLEQIETISGDNK